MAARRPDIVVGIDVGQTCSGVAYSIGPDWHHPRTINLWPGSHGDVKADKVATRVGYSQSQGGGVQAWGFECMFGDTNLEVREQFKLTLDHEYNDGREGYDCHHARRWYADYLKCLYAEIVKFFNDSVPRWHSLNVEYSFSTPTTWNNPAMIASIEGLIKAAGFASTPRQTVRMGLTEAEAAAIDACKTRYANDDVFLICDAGGGTTDVNLLKVKSLDDKVELEPLDHVEGVSVGSTLIDYRMAEHIVQRLAPIADSLDGDLYYLAEEMLTGKFQTIKHSFPKPPVDQYWLDVKGLAGAQSFPDAGIKDSRISIARETLKDIFDQQVSRIFNLIDERLLALQDEFFNLQVSYVILSGGFGSSPYLYEQLKRRYEKNEGFASNNTALIRIMRVLEPQLAVVRGLVRERTQQLGKGPSAGEDVYKTRHCRNSYGVAVREAYNFAKHGMASTIKGNDGREWVENCIDWFIYQGQTINVSDGVGRKYESSLTKEELDVPRSVRIVMSTSPLGELPIRTTDANCKEVVLVNYKLTANDMRKVETWKLKDAWASKGRKLKQKYWKTDLTLVVKPGPADLRFEVRGSNGLVSTDHESLSVEFLDSPPKSRVDSGHEAGNFVYR
ncbi:hypothetical protein AC578_5259 [Pseudocercospora eumusae]|uniref:Uncharacterized protein n=1 Tax=Pseudocercospora eumusae TaxID=321146 RepID=A0A139GZD6_9PEZI|nr:hypothetical protein AC578_5259 [Pseudocercospora eumusae]